jgi:hypothetical protein
MSLAQSTKKHDAGKVPGAWACPSVVEIKCQIALSPTKPMFFIVHGVYTSAPNVGSMATALFTSISSAWNTNLAALMATSTIFQTVFVRDMANPNNQVAIGTGTAVPGTSASPAMSPGAALVLTEQVNLRGRGLKGRIFMGGWATNADAAGGIPSAAAITGMQGWGTGLFNAVQGQSLIACVAQPPRYAYIGYTGTSHPARGSTNPSTGTHAPVTSYSFVDQRWNSQRRRQQP